MPNPNPRYTPFLSGGGVESIMQAVNKGLATAETLIGETIQLRRTNTATGRFVAHGAPIGLISIDFGLREVRRTLGLPVQETNSDGDIKLWEEDFVSVGMRVGDRFEYKDMTCEVSAIYPPQFGFVVAEVNLKQSSA